MATSQALSWLLCRSLYSRLSHPILKVSSPGFWGTLLAFFLAIFPHFLWLAHHHLVDHFGLFSGPQSLPISFSLLYWKASLCITLQTFPLIPVLVCSTIHQTGFLSGVADTPVTISLEASCCPALKSLPYSGRQESELRTPESFSMFFPFFPCHLHEHKPRCLYLCSESRDRLVIRFIKFLLAQDKLISVLNL